MASFQRFSYNIANTCTQSSAHCFKCSRYIRVIFGTLRTLNLLANRATSFYLNISGVEVLVQDTWQTFLCIGLCERGWTFLPLAEGTNVSRIKVHNTLFIWALFHNTFIGKYSKEFVLLDVYEPITFLFTLDNDSSIMVKVFDGFVRLMHSFSFSELDSTQPR